MKRIIIMLAVLASLAVPAVASASSFGVRYSNSASGGSWTVNGVRSDITRPSSLTHLFLNNGQVALGVIQVHNQGSAFLRAGWIAYENAQTNVCGSGKNATAGHIYEYADWQKGSGATGCWFPGVEWGAATTRTIGLRRDGTAGNTDWNIRVNGGVQKTVVQVGLSDLTASSGDFVEIYGEMTGSPTSGVSGTETVFGQPSGSTEWQHISTTDAQGGGSWVDFGDSTTASQNDGKWNIGNNAGNASWDIFFCSPNC